MTEQTHPLSPRQGTRVKAYSITHDPDRPTPEPTRVPNYHKHKPQTLALFKLLGRGLARLKTGVMCNDMGSATVMLRLLSLLG